MLCVTQEHRLEIDARAGTFQAFEMFGHQLLQNTHYASDQVKDKLQELSDARQLLEQSVLITHTTQFINIHK